MISQNMDYLIVGAGSTGVHLASTLAERGARVVIYDSASSHRSPFYLQPPLLAPFLLENTKYAKAFKTLAQSGLTERSTSLFSSRLIGGLAEMNGSVCFAGHKEIYKSAFSAVIEDYHAVVEQLLKIDNPYTEKIYKSRRYAWKTPISNEFLRYWGQGSESDVDFDQVLLGSGPLRNNRRGYGRYTALQRFRKHVRSGLIRLVDRSKVSALRVESGVVTGLLIEGSTCFSNIEAKKVILCAGVIGSPEILLRSGIGDPEDLTRVGIEVKVELPGVGKNLCDHPNFRIPFWSSRYAKWSISNYKRNVVEALKFSFGFASQFGSSGASSAANFMVGLDGDMSNIVRVQLVHFSLKKSGDRNTFAMDSESNFSLSISLLAPLSRGSVTLSRDQTLQVSPGYLSNPYDIENLACGFKRGVKFIRSIGGLMREDIKMLDNKDSIELFIRNNVNTGYHMVGTCSMGDDHGKYVCNADLSVKKMKNLYVCDASVFPSQISSNTYMPCLLLADYFAVRNL